MTSTIRIAAAVAAGGGLRSRTPEAARRQGVEDLTRLTKRLQAVADKLSSPDGTRAERTALRTQVNELERLVNLLDGIVAGEGLETVGRHRLARGDSGRSTAAAPVRAGTGGDADSTAAPPATTGPAPVTDTPGPPSRLDILA